MASERERIAFRIPEKLDFPNREYHDATGALSTLHDILLRPLLRKQKEEVKRKNKQASTSLAPPRWTEEDKANLVKIFDDRKLFDDPTLSVSVQNAIREKFAVSDEEITQYRSLLDTYGLPGLAADSAQKLREMPTKRISFGPFSLNSVTGDLRCDGYFARLNDSELQILRAFQGKGSGNIVSHEILQATLGGATRNALRQNIDARMEKMRRLSRKTHFKNVYGKGYVFALFGFEKSPDLEPRK